ncbi:hypothetical protein H2200_013177 [Cladophialophora chaetospira]|uniref:Uncharacterized protein n=1 Tax=Cladophialophora chaetospira TaxID=386627 RepID=A0AA38WWC2_9EURO|nr:hypothetical protein H2200_013177 [Cladophialophora chaetospira]
MLPLESSVAAHKLVDAPVKFLIVAVMLYIIGFGTDRFAPRIHASQEFQTLERIITILVEFRRANEAKLQVGTESEKDSSLMLDLLLQLWDETEQHDRHGSRTAPTTQNTTGLKSDGRDAEYGEMIQRGYSYLRGEACGSSILDTISESKLAPRRLQTDSGTARHKPAEGLSSSPDKGRRASM